MTLDELPVKSGPTRGTNSFSEAGELKIHEAITQGFSYEAVAFYTRTTVVTIRNICGRVKKRLEEGGPDADTPGPIAINPEESHATATESLAQGFEDDTAA